MRILLLAGEASGDRMAAGVVREIRRLAPDADIRAMGGAALRAEGVPLVVDSTELAVVGIVEVLRVLPALLRARRAVREALERWRPDVLVPVDYPDFNVRLALHARTLGIPVAWLVSPQVWAWRPGRVHQYARAVSRMMVLFPFEAALWDAAGVPAVHVGHPLADAPVPPSREEARAILSVDTHARILAILPGSRRSEIRRTWPVLATAAGHLAREEPGLQVLVPLAPGLHAGLLPAGLAAPAHVRHLEARVPEAVAAADLALVASGTAALETALVPRALIVGYRVSRATMALSRPLMDAGFLRRGMFCLPNLVLGRPVVPELYQERFDAAAVADAAGRLLRDDAARAAMEDALRALRPALGGSGAATRIAHCVLETATCR